MDGPEPLPNYLCTSFDDTPGFLLATRGVADGLFSRCWNSQTLEAFSEKFNRTVWMLVPCNQWGCRQCAGHKISQLSFRTNEAKPNRLLTLTIDPSKWENPRASFDGTRRQVPELVRRLRLKFDAVEYLRVTELTTKGWPHYHMLIRSGYLPHALVRRYWMELTGASIVDLRPVKNRFQCYTYLVKYLSKMHNLGWTNRHVSTSKKFFPPAKEQPKDPYKLKNKTFIQQRPGNYLYEMYRGATLVQLAPHVYGLQRPEDPAPTMCKAPLGLEQTSANVFTDKTEQTLFDYCKPKAPPPCLENTSPSTSPPPTSSTE